VTGTCECGNATSGSKNVGITGLAENWLAFHE